MNASKTHITRPSKLKYLDFTFNNDNKDNLWKSKSHKESYKRLFWKLKELVNRSCSAHLTRRIKKINEVLMGCINYYRKSSMEIRLEKLDR